MVEIRVSSLTVFSFSEYVFGPRLTPLLTTVMILVHILLPVFHAYSWYVIYSYLNGPRTRGLPLANAPSIAGSTAALNGHQVKAKSGHQCQKCQLAKAMEAGNGNGHGANNRCASTPLIKPIETTC